MDLYHCLFFLFAVSSPDVNPTLLHFAARYNLLRLALALLDCHGGHRALNVANSEELTPSQIAHELGHEKLAEILVCIECTRIIIFGLLFIRKTHPIFP